MNHSVKKVTSIILAATTTMSTGTTLFAENRPNTVIEQSVNSSTNQEIEQSGLGYKNVTQEAGVSIQSFGGKDTDIFRLIDGVKDESQGSAYLEPSSNEVIIDLGKVQGVDKFETYWAAAPSSMGVPFRYEIYLSTDGSEYEKVVDAVDSSNYISDSYNANILSETKQARYVKYKILGHSGGSAYGSWLFEFCVMGKREGKINRFELSENEVILPKNHSKKITAEVELEGFLPGEECITWGSSDIDIVSVNERGEIKANSPGVAYITATCGEQSLECKVTVPEPKAYINDYEDKNYQPNWSNNANVSIVGDEENAYLEITSELENTYIDLDSPSLVEGTISFDYNFEVLSQEKDFKAGFGYRYSERNKTDEMVMTQAGWKINDSTFALDELDIPKTNTWHKAVLVFEEGELKVYVDGLFRKTIKISQNEVGQFGIHLENAKLKVDNLVCDGVPKYPQLDEARIQVEENYQIDHPKWSQEGIVEEGIFKVEIPGSSVITNNNIPACAYGLMSWEIMTNSTGKFGVAFNAVEERFNALYVNDENQLILKFADGTMKEIPMPLTLEANKKYSIDIFVNKQMYKIFINGVLLMTEESPDLDWESGQIGLYNPNQASTSMGIGKIKFKEAYNYFNDFSDSQRIGGFEGSNCNVSVEDEKLKLDMLSATGSAAIANATPLIENGIYEFDFKDINQPNRMGFLFRFLEIDGVADSVGYDINSTWTWGSEADWGYLPGFVGNLGANTNKNVKIKMIVNEQSVEVYMNDTLVGKGMAANKPRLGRFGFSKRWNATTFIVDNLRITELLEPTMPVGEVVPESISSEQLSVVMDKSFPRVIRYEKNGKTLEGNPHYASEVLINNEKYKPLVSCEKVDDKNLRYTLSVPSIGVTFKVSYEVDENQLKMKVTDVIETGDFKVTTFQFNKNPLVSSTAGAKDASFASVETSGAWHGIKDYIFDDLNQLKEEDYIKGGRGYAMISSNGLAATINNASQDAPTKIWTEINKTDQGAVASFSDGFMYIRTPLDEKNDTLKEELPWSIVAICEDYNGDGSVNWQDAAVNNKNIRHEVFGMDQMKNNIMWISQDSFLRSLDAGKLVYNLTDGFGQMIMQKGFADEGHDTSHGDYGGNVNQRSGGKEDFNKAIEAGEAYNMKFGVHINVSEHHPDGLYFNREVMGDWLAPNWGWLDQAYFVNEQADILTGNRKKNLELMKSDLPKLNFVYCDIYANSSWMAEDLVKNLNNLGWIAGTEFAGAMEQGTMFTHWGHDSGGLGGGYTSQGNNSTILKYIKNDFDIFVTSALFSNSKMPGVNSWGGANPKNATDAFFNKTLAYKYLAHQDVLDIEKDHVQFSNGVRTERIKTANSWEDPGLVEMTKDGKKMAQWKYVDINQDKDHTWAKEEVFGATLFIPWFAEGSLTENPDDADKVYHFNSDGGETTWDIPQGWSEKGITQAKLYKLSLDNKEEVGTLDISNDQITIQAEKGVGYVLYPAEAQAPRVAQNYGEGDYLENGAFYGKKLEGWGIIRNGQIEAESITENSSGNGTLPRLKITGSPGSDIVFTQKIRNLVPGEGYSTYIESDLGQKDVKLSVTVKIGDVEKTQTLYPAAENYIDYMAGSGQKQRISVKFKVPEDYVEGDAEFFVRAECNEEAEVYINQFDVWHSPDPISEPGENYVFWEDFENMDGLFGTFNFAGPTGWYTHLAQYREERNQYTDFVVNGNYSLKIGEYDWAGRTEENPYELMRSHPSAVKLDKNTTYEISFGWQCGYNGGYRLSVKRPNGEYVWTSEALTDTPVAADRLRYDNLYIEPSQFTTGDYDDYYLVVEQVGDIYNTSSPGYKPPVYKETLKEYNGAGVFVIDDIKIKQIDNLEMLKEIQIDENKVELQGVGETKVLNVLYKPEDTTVDKAKVSWKSYDESVVTVNNQGEIVATGVGTTTVVASCEGKSDYTIITVGGEEVPLESIELDRANLELQVGGSEKLNVIYNPAHAGINKTVVWKSDNEEVATVDHEGNVTAKAEGECIITATCEGKLATCNVTVKKESIKEITMTLPDEVVAGKIMEVEIGIGTLNEKVYAQDFKVDYDKELFELLEVEPIAPTVVPEKDLTQGRILAASIDGITSNTPILKLKFRVKSVDTSVSGKIALESQLGIVKEGISSSIPVEVQTASVNIKPAPVEVDKTQLLARIEEANQLLESAVVGDKPGQYPQSAVDQLKKAIERAEKVASLGETQDEVDAASLELAKAIKVFETTQITGTKEDINKDGKVDIADLALVAYYYKVSEADTDRWEEAKKADINEDGKIEIEDLASIANKILDK